MNRATYARLSKCSNIAGANNPRITRDDLQTLRAASQRKDTVGSTMAKVQAEVSAFVASMFACKPKRTHNMCQNYGHVIHGSWTGAYPNCGDCGHTITSPDQLRKASVAHN